MHSASFILFTLFQAGARCSQLRTYPAPACKCVPGQACWPSDSTWKIFNQHLGGKLIKTSPIAESCYSGSSEDLTECAYIDSQWTLQDFMTSNPVGRPYPYNITCAPVDYSAGDVPTTCALGISPTYATNVTTRSDIIATMDFARQHNIRLVIASTGHDLLGRSDGFGSLEIWLRHYRNSIDFQETYKSGNECTKSGWNGTAIHIDGAWQWKDVYQVANASNVIVVGGGSAGPCSTGGWPSGGGHGPATHNYGLGADQILEAEVLLASGEIVTANHCENTDLFKALRGGGPGYGIVLSTTVKAYPNVHTITAHHLAISPLFATPNNSILLDAVSVLIQSYPDLNDAGLAGYAYWFRNFPGPFIGNATSGYTHGFWAIGKTQAEVDVAFAPVKAKLEKFKFALLIEESYTSYTNYYDFYYAESNVEDPTGDTSILTSRLINREAVADYAAVREAVEVISGEPDEYTSNVVLLVSGGQVSADASDETSGVNPAWRVSPFALVTGRGVPRNATDAVRKYVDDDITFVKGAAQKKLAPNTGGYMNEGDRNDPDYINTFYGTAYAGHLAAKKKYDPTNLFYCPTCVGSEAFIERLDGRLCVNVLPLV